MEFSANPNLSDFGIFFFVVLRMDETVLQGDWFFFKVVSVVFVK